MGMGMRTWRMRRPKSQSYSRSRSRSRSRSQSRTSSATEERTALRSECGKCMPGEWERERVRCKTWNEVARQSKARHDTTRATAADQATRRQAAAVRNESECRSQRRSQRRRRRCGRDHSLWSSPRGALQFKLHLKNCDASQRPHDQRQVSAPVCSYLLPPLLLPPLFTLRAIEAIY